jgi:hypothetical protein
LILYLLMDSSTILLTRDKNKKMGTAPNTGSFAMPYLYHVGLLSSLQSSKLLFTLVLIYGTAKTRSRWRLL